MSRSDLALSWDGCWKRPVKVVWTSLHRLHCSRCVWAPSSQRVPPLDALSMASETVSVSAGSSDQPWEEDSKEEPL